MSDQRIRLRWHPTVLAALGQPAAFKAAMARVTAETRLLAVCTRDQRDTAMAEVKRREALFRSGFEDSYLAALDSVTQDVARGRLA